MRIAILSQAPRCYSTRRLREAAEQRKHDVQVLDTSRLSLLLENGRHSIFYRGEPLPAFDAVIPRIGASVTFFGTAVVRQFEQMRVYCLNCAEAIIDARDKLRSMQLLNRHDVGIPPTAFVRCNKYFLPAIESVGGAPVVLKLLQGAQGVGVILADSTRVAQAILEALRSARQNMLIQKFVSESRGRDIRAIVVGDRVVASMRRVAQGHEFRSNVHRGAKTEPVKLDQQYLRTALRAAHVLGLQVAGVDMLESADGPQVTEVNSSPGLQAIEAASGLDVAAMIIQFLEAEISCPPEPQHRSFRNASLENDHHEDYRVRDVAIVQGSELDGATVESPCIQERGLVVLKLRRGNEEILRPDRSVTILAGDNLMCFGRSEELDAVASVAEHATCRGRPADRDRDASPHRGPHREPG